MITLHWVFVFVGLVIAFFLGFCVAAICAISGQCSRAEELQAMKDGVS